MEKQDIINYIMNTPDNTNPAVLSSIIDEFLEERENLIGKEALIEYAMYTSHNANPAVIGSLVDQLIPDVPTENPWLCFTAEEAGSTVKMNKIGSAPAVELEYSVDGGMTWSPFTVGSTEVTLSSIGDKMYLRGDNTTFASSTSMYNYFVMTGKIAASGKITSIIDSSMEATTLATYCYYGMFNGCTSLTTAPELPATELADYCYASMFNGCTSLTVAPELPATTLATQCYAGMFSNCLSLNYIKLNYTGTFSTSYFSIWVLNVSDTGDFYYNGTDITTGSYAIPEEWTVHTF